MRRENIKTHILTKMREMTVQHTEMQYVEAHTLYQARKEEKIRNGEKISKWGTLTLCWETSQEVGRRQKKQEKLTFWGAQAVGYVKTKEESQCRKLTACKAQRGQGIRTWKEVREWEAHTSYWAQSKWVWIQGKVNEHRALTNCQ